jgi:PTS system nitrogen regulatory IIA component
MPITNFLSISDIRIDLPAIGKMRLLRQLSAYAAAELGLEGELVFSEVLKRELLDSTGLGGGIAVPHARFPDVERPFGMMVRLRKPIDFDAIDGRPVDLIFLLLLPTASNADHLSALAEISEKVRNPRIVQELRKAGSEAALYRILVRSGTLASAISS